MNVLIDTNVLLSAALRDRLPERVVVYVAGRDDVRWLVTPEILGEYAEILRRPKFGLDEQRRSGRGRAEVVLLHCRGGKRPRGKLAGSTTQHATSPRAGRRKTR